VKHSAFFVTKLILSEQFTALSVTVFSAAQIGVGTVPGKTDVTYFGHRLRGAGYDSSSEHQS